MFDIGDKKQLIQQIQCAIDCHYLTKPYSSLHQNYNPLTIQGRPIEGFSSFNDQLTKFIIDVSYEIACSVAKEAAKEAVNQVITRLYTYSEFEQDLGLRDTSK